MFKLEIFADRKIKWQKFNTVEEMGDFINQLFMLSGFVECKVLTKLTKDQRKIFNLRIGRFDVS